MLRRAIHWLSGRIARKLGVAFFSVFLLTYLATALVVLSAVKTAVTEADLGTLAQRARLHLNELDARVEQLATNLRAWSKLDQMNDLASGDVDKRVALTLENLKNEYALKGDLFAFDNTGRLVAASGASAGMTSLPAIWRSNDQLRFIDKHASPQNGKPIVALSVPVISAFSSGFRLGTLVLTYPWSEIESTLSGAAILLRLDQRPVLLESTLTGVGSGAALSDIARQHGWVNIGGQRYLVNNASNEGGLLSGWQVAVLQPPDALDLTLRGVALKLAVLCLVLAVPLTLAILWLSRLLTAPLRDLGQVVTDITDTGDLARRVTLPSNDEIGALAMSFNQLAARLESASVEREKFVGELEQAAQELEHKVRARTGELTAANAELTRTLDELKAAQSQLIQQERLASLGQLVAGVAHELNNPIGFIYANFPHLEEYAQTLLALLDEFRQLPMSEADRHRLDARLAEADLEFLRQDLMKLIKSGKSGASRVKEIIASLRSFSRLDEAVLKAVRLEEGLDDTLALLHHHYKSRIQVVRDYRLKLPVLCRPGQINQVFMNIIFNAIQAIEGPGTITVRTRAEGGQAVVDIEDTGRGIPAEIRDKIFDPFFTTKKVGEGTGLGLSISYGIIEQHGGHIAVASGPGGGTRFTLSLPLTPKAQHEH